MRAVPLSLEEANELVARLHRHHKPAVGHRFSIGVMDGDRLVGAAIIGRPVARMLNPAEVVEVVRLVTDGTKNACSFLYGAASRAAKAMGYSRIQTYTLPAEGGHSLRAAGWRPAGETSGGQWKHTDGRPRRRDQPTDPKARWVLDLNPPLPGPREVALAAFASCGIEEAARRE